MMKLRTVLFATSFLACSVYGIHAQNTVDYGIDLSSVNCRVACWVSPGAALDGSGNLVANGLYSSYLTINGSSFSNTAVAGSGSTVDPYFVAFNGTSTANVNLDVSAMGSGTLKLNMGAAGAPHSGISSTGPLQVGPGLFTANGNVSVSLGSVAPAGAHATVQEWFTVTDSAGNVRYIPAF